MAKTNQKRPLEVATFANNANSAYNAHKTQKRANINATIDVALFTGMAASFVAIASINDFELNLQSLAAIGGVALFGLICHCLLKARKVVD